MEREGEDIGRVATHLPPASPGVWYPREAGGLRAPLILWLLSGPWIDPASSACPHGCWHVVVVVAVFKFGSAHVQ